VDENPPTVKPSVIGWAIFAVIIGLIWGRMRLLDKPLTCVDIIELPDAVENHVVPL
jgi:hypothetical protein